MLEHIATVSAAAAAESGNAQWALLAICTAVITWQAKKLHSAGDITGSRISSLIALCCAGALAAGTAGPAAYGTFVAGIVALGGTVAAFLLLMFVSVQIADRTRQARR